MLTQISEIIIIKKIHSIEILVKFTFNFVFTKFEKKKKKKTGLVKF